MRGLGGYEGNLKLKLTKTKPNRPESSYPGLCVLDSSTRFGLGKVRKIVESEDAKLLRPTLF
jgi:hypothetical protein